MSKPDSGRPWPAIVLLLASQGACINEDIRLYELELRGRVTVADGLPASGELQLELHHAEGGTGRFAHPLGMFAEFADVGAPGETLAVDTRVPLDEGSGLVVYAWLDVDGDGILCAPGVSDEPAGLVELADFPAHTLDFSLSLTTPCVGPEALYP